VRSKTKSELIKTRKERQNFKTQERETERSEKKRREEKRR
jgi:hypothetical protein